MNIQPLFDRAVLKDITNDHQTISGITFQTAKQDVRRARVLFVGTGAHDNGTFIPMNVKPNDVVYFEPFTACKFILDGEELLLIKQTDILAKEVNK